MYNELPLPRVENMVTRLTVAGDLIADNKVIINIHGDASDAYII